MRFGSLYVFNVAVLFVIGLLMPPVRVGFHALWAAVILTIAALAVKPLLIRAFRSAAARSAGRRSTTGEKVVQYGIVFVVELIVWILTVLLSGVTVGGFFWGWVIPPVLLLVGWVVYDRLDDRFRTAAGELYDAAEARLGRRSATADTPPQPPTTAAGRQELKDGLTPEQRKLLDEL